MPRMEPTVLTLVLLAAILHAAWNALLKQNGDRLTVMALISASSVLFAALIGRLFLGERGGSRRIVSAGLVAGGIILLNA